MIYFDNAATDGKKPYTVLKTVQSTLNGICANPGRSGHKLSIQLEENIYNARKLIANFFGNDSYERIIFTKNCTEALNIAIFGIVANYYRHTNTTQLKTPHIITTVAEHNSVLRPLYALKQMHKIDLTILPLKNERILPQDILDNVQENTIAVVFTLTSNVTGMHIDPYALKDKLPSTITVVCDGAQAAGHIDINMQAMGIDCLAIAGHKGLHGIAGSGLLLFNAKTEIAPIHFGGTGSNSLQLTMPDFYPDMLEAGTLNYPAIISMVEGILYLKENLHKDRIKIEELTKICIQKLKTIASIKLYSAPNPFGIVAFADTTMLAEDICTELSEEYAICTRAGLHCAPLMHTALHTEVHGLIRLSFSASNSLEEIDYFIVALQRILNSAKKL